MKYVLASVFFATFGHLAEPVYAAEPLTLEQMDQVTAGAVSFKFTFQSLIKVATPVVDANGNVSVASVAGNSNSTVQCTGCP